MSLGGSGFRSYVLQGFEAGARRVCGWLVACALVRGLQPALGLARRAARRPRRRAASIRNVIFPSPRDLRGAGNRHRVLRDFC